MVTMFIERSSLMKAVPFCTFGRTLTLGSLLVLAAGVALLAADRQRLAGPSGKREARDAPASLSPVALEGSAQEN